MPAAGSGPEPARRPLRRFPRASIPDKPFSCLLPAGPQKLGIYTAAPLFTPCSSFLAAGVLSRRPLPAAFPRTTSRFRFPPPPSRSALPRWACPAVGSLLFLWSCPPLLPVCPGRSARILACAGIQRFRGFLPVPLRLLVQVVKRNFRFPLFRLFIPVPQTVSINQAVFIVGNKNLDRSVLCPEIKTVRIAMNDRRTLRLLRHFLDVDFVIGVNSEIAAILRVKVHVAIFVAN